MQGVKKGAQCIFAFDEKNYQDLNHQCCIKKREEDFTPIFPRGKLLCELTLDHGLEIFVFQIKFIYFILIYEKNFVKI